MKLVVRALLMIMVIAIAWFVSERIVNIPGLEHLTLSTLGEMDGWTFAGLALVIAASGFVSGLSGFGFSAIGALTLWFLPPLKAIPLLMALSTVNQLMSMHQLTASFNRETFRSAMGPLPYMAGGLAGIPAGLWILSSLDAEIVCALIGLVLIAYALWSLFKPDHGVKIAQGPVRSALVGALGGTIGGFTAFPGCAVVIWAGLVGMSKTEQRTTVQPFILSMQLVSLAGLAVSRPEQFGVEFWVMLVPLAAIALPFTKLGVAVFHQLSEANFKQATHGLLSVSGATLLAKAAPLLFKISAKAHLILVATLTSVQQWMDF